MIGPRSSGAGARVSMAGGIVGTVEVEGGSVERRVIACRKPGGFLAFGPSRLIRTRTPMPARKATMNRATKADDKSRVFVRFLVDFFIAVDGGAARFTADRPKRDARKRIEID